MKLYVAVALCLFVTLGSAADLDKCAWGESYWCSDLQAAKTCGAFKHCMSTVWKNQKLAQDSTEVCDFCEAIFDDVRRFVSDNRTESDVSHFLLSACGVVPEETIAAACKILVQDFIPEIMQLLSENVDPRVVCSLMKMCRGLEDKVMHSEQRSRQALVHIPLQKMAVVDQPDYCGDCKRFFTDAKIKLTDKTEQEVLEQFLDNVWCVWFGPMKKRCQEMVSAFLPLYLEYIAQFDDPTMICSLIRFCTEDARPPIDDGMLKVYGLLRMAKNVSDDKCTTCKSIVAELQALVRNPSLQKQIVEFLKDKVCPLFGASQNQCTDMVDRFAPSTFELLATWLDPDARCRGFGFCPKSASSGSSVNDIVHHDTPEVPSWKLHEVSDPQLCALCEYILKEVQSLLAKNSTEEEIIAGLDRVCNVLPSPLDKSCKDFVNQYVSDIITMLRQAVDPDEICALLGLCSKKPVTAQASSSSVKDTPPVLSWKLLEVSDPQECDLCKLALSMFKSLLAKNSTTKEIVDTLDKLCGLLPSPSNATCKNFVDQYVADFFAHLHIEFDPAEVCAMFGLCPVTAHASTSPVNKHTVNVAAWKSSPEECELCEFALNAVKNLLSKNSTEKEILDTLDKLCGRLPGHMSTSCKSFVKEYVPAIIAMIQQEVDPAEICSLLGLCSQKPVTARAGTSRVNKDTPNMAAWKLREVSSPEECELCKFALSTVKSLLAKNSTEKKILDTLNKLCGLLPSPSNASCKDFVKEYVPAIIAMIQQEVDPEQICALLGLCSQTPVTTRANDDMCLVCETTVQYLEAMLDDKTAVVEIEKLMKKICNFLPDSMKSQCTNIVDMYGPVIIHLIATEYTPEQVCKIIKLCSSEANKVPMTSLESGKMKLVGTNKCTQGPAYWCASEENAKQCGTVEHCQKYVWKI